MWVRMLVGAFVGAVVFMIWGAVFWALTPLGKNMTKPIEYEDAVLSVLDQSIDATGVYFVPLKGMHEEGSSRETFLEKHKKGPVARISFRKEGVDPQGPAVFIKGFVHLFASVLLLMLIMRSAVPHLAGFGARLGFVATAGLFAAFFTHLSDSIWFHAPFGYAVGYAAFHVVGWLLVGLALSPIIKPRPAAPA